MDPSQIKVVAYLKEQSSWTYVKDSVTSLINQKVCHKGAPSPKEPGFFYWFSPLRLSAPPKQPERPETVHRKYIYDNFDLYDLVMFVRYKNQDRGFLLAQLKPDELYIDVVCSFSGLGKYLLNEAVSYATSNGLNVGLSALPEVITYYQQFGFKFRKNCSESAFVPDSVLFAQVKDSAKIGRTETAELAFKDRATAELLAQLQENELNVNKKSKYCRKSVAQKVKGLRAYYSNCGTNGYSMKRCLSGGRSGRSLSRHSGRRNRGQTKRRNKKSISWIK